MRIPDKIIWMMFRRRRLMRSIPGFWAHWNTYADSSCSFSEENELHDGAFLSNVNLGRFTYIAGARVRYASIGKFCSIASEAMVGGLGKHPTNFLSTHPVFYSKKRRFGAASFNKVDFDELPATEIGHDVWIGTRAVILDGITVGNGAIIASNAVVTKDVEPYTLVAGVPARPMRERFSQDIISCLESWNWWDLPTSALRKLSPFFNRDTWILDDINKMISMTQEKNF